MRPRVFPAEDGLRRPGAAPERPASMRPRVFPAEDFSVTGPPCANNTSFNEAAGIPRGRPWRSERRSRTRRSFNEAAGIPRGRLGRGVEARLGLGASMRPRVFPAEDFGRPISVGGGRTSFNEAAGIPRGRRASRSCNWSTAGRFNEAAGIPRGRRTSVARFAPT